MSERTYTDQEALLVFHLRSRGHIWRMIAIMAGFPVHDLHTLYARGKDLAEEGPRGS
jgi:hypothetical protein